jgi:DNA polymerase-3 subunit delta'
VARLINHILGHSEILERLISSLRSGRLPHTFLFAGPPGVGRKASALAFAQILLCEKSPDVCGFCGSCLRVTQVATQGTRTESLLIVAPEKNQIKIEQAREILDFLSLRTVGRNRVVMIDGAETLNPQAANALLKALEEPPDGTYFFMVAPSASHILPTLRSRAQVVSFQPLSLEDMKKRSKAPDWALRASQGSFERLAQLMEKDELEIRESALAWLRDWSREPQAYLHPENRDLVRDRQAARSLARHVSWLLRDALYLKIEAADQILNSDQIPFLREISDQMDRAALLAACEKSIWIEQKLAQNQDSSLVFEQFWIETRPVG